MVTWPLQLPQVPLVDGFEYQIGDSLLRSDNDTGPAKIRARMTRSVDRVSVRMMLTRAQWAYMLGFYRTDLGNGVSAFTFVDPYTLESATWRFLSPPKMQPEGALNVSVSMDWEKLP